MHADQRHIDADIARRLIADQYPEWRELAVTPLADAGTVHAIYRLGSELAARFPLQGDDPGMVHRWLRAEAAAMAELADCAPFAAPRPVTIGVGGAGYPLPWSVQTWVPGTVATPHSVAHSEAFAGDLAVLIRALRGADLRGRRFSGTGRGGVLRYSDDWMARCIRESESLVDIDGVDALWARLRTLPDAETNVMSHGDLIPANLITGDGRLVGVLDGGGFGAADPALDLVAGWHLLDDGPRATLRDSLRCDDAEWHRGAGWALVQAMGLVWYYLESHPAMAAFGRSTIDRILADDDLRARSGR